jgi:hypothetical protein
VLGNRREAEFVPGFALGLSLYSAEEVIFVPARADQKDRSPALEAGSDDLAPPFKGCATNGLTSGLSGIFYRVVNY